MTTSSNRHALLKNRLLIAWMAATVCAVVVVTGAVVWVNWPWLSMGNWRATLQEAEAEEVRTYLAAAAGSGLEGIPYLVEALASDRAEVTQTAAALLHRQCACWDQMPTGLAAKHQRLLANELAARAGRFDTNALGIAARLAEKILARPLESHGPGALELTRSCEQVIRSAQRTVSSARKEQLALLDYRKAPTSKPIASQPAVSDGVVSAGRPTRTAAAGARASYPPGATERLPGGTVGWLDMSAELDELAGIAGPATDEQRATSRKKLSPVVEETQHPQRAQWAKAPSGTRYARLVTAPVESENPPATQVRQKGPAVASETERAGATASVPSGSGGDHDGYNKPTGDLSPLATNGRTETPDQAASAGTRPNNAAVFDAKLEALDTRTLIGLLGGAGEDQSCSIIEELRRRGFSEQELAVARRLADPDPLVRRSLCELLPDLGELDPVPWLLELARDKDARVRLAALSLLATTADPVLVERVRELASVDPDPQVRQLQSAIERLQTTVTAQGSGPRSIR